AGVPPGGGGWGRGTTGPGSAAASGLRIRRAGKGYSRSPGLRTWIPGGAATPRATTTSAWPWKRRTSRRRPSPLTKRPSVSTRFTPRPTATRAKFWQKRTGRAEAIAPGKEAVRLKPALAPAHSPLGHTFWRKRQLDPAIAAFRNATRLDPDYAEAYCYLGNLLLFKGRSEE